jgi:RHS repeat-associated protein
VAIYVKDSIPQKDTICYAFTDCQSNLVALTDANGNVYQRLAYDPWGNRRNPDDWTQKAASTTHYLFNRGYTLHEHLDAFALINMSGRVYDPVLGTFLSPDPYVQAPDNWLNYNRYSYCLGNPLRYNDPTGKLSQDQIMTIFNNAEAATDTHYTLNLYNDGTLNSTASTNASQPDNSSNESGNGKSSEAPSPAVQPERGKADGDKNYVAGDNGKDGNKPENSSKKSSSQGTVTGKKTRTFFSVPGIKMKGYSTTTIKNGSNSSVETVVDARTLKFESLKIRTPIGIFSFSENESTHGNDIISIGTTKDGQGILDLSIPLGNESYGTTIYFNPENFENNAKSIGNFIYKGLSTPAPVLIPMPMILFPAP